MENWEGKGMEGFCEELLPLPADEAVVPSQVRVMKEVRNSDFTLIESSAEFSWAGRGVQGWKSCQNPALPLVFPALQGFHSTWQPRRRL